MALELINFWFLKQIILKVKFVSCDKDLQKCNAWCKSWTQELAEKTT